jgi:flagellar hook-associated protein 2
VTDYNSLARLLASLQSYDAATQKGGPMLGDAYLRGLESQLRRDMTDPVASAGDALNSLATIGIRTDSNGQLVVDDTKLNAALAGNFDGVAALLGGTDGVATRLYGRLDASLKVDAQLATRTDSLNQQVRSIAKDKAQVDDRMAAVEARYRAQFTALDTLLAQMQSTSTFLSQQLGAAKNSG